MNALSGKTVAVAGGTGNVGSFIVRGLLKEGARVAVPSRSEEKIESLRNHIRNTDGSDPDRLYTITGNLSNEKDAARILNKITGQVGVPDAVVSSLGHFIPAPSLLSVDPGDLEKVMDGYLIAHFKVARTFLPVLKENGGTFVFINGPLAINPWKGTGLVSIATAGQQMLFKSLAKELEASRVRVIELMSYAFIRDRQTQPSSDLAGEDVGAYISWLVSGSSEGIHGETIHLRSPNQLKEIGIG